MQAAPLAQAVPRHYHLQFVSERHGVAGRFSTHCPTDREALPDWLTKLRGAVMTAHSGVAWRELRVLQQIPPPPGNAPPPQQTTVHVRFVYRYLIYLIMCMKLSYVGFLGLKLGSTVGAITNQPLFRLLLAWATQRTKIIAQSGNGGKSSNSTTKGRQEPACFQSSPLSSSPSVVFANLVEKEPRWKRP